MADLEKIAEDLSALSVLEAAELSKLLEEKWGVSAAAPVAVAAAPAAGGDAGGEAAEAKDSFTVVLASATGLPISTTHTLVGAVLGVGLARGVEAVSLPTIGKIFASWLVTLPAGAGLAIVFFYLLSFMFGA